MKTVTVFRHVHTLSFLASLALAIAFFVMHVQRIGNVQGTLGGAVAVAVFCAWVLMYFDCAPNEPCKNPWSKELAGFVVLLVLGLVPLVVVSLQQFRDPVLYDLLIAVFVSFAVYVVSALLVSYTSQKAHNA